MVGDDELVKLRGHQPSDGGSQTGGIHGAEEAGLAAPGGPAESLGRGRGSAAVWRTLGPGIAMVLVSLIIAMLLWLCLFKKKCISDHDTLTHTRHTTKALKEHVKCLTIA